MRADLFKELPSVFHDADSKTKVMDAITKTAALCKLAKTSEEDEEPKEVPPLPDLLAEAELLEWAGFSLGREEVFKLSRSVQELATNANLTNVRLFGRIFGTKKDYFVVEAKMAEPPEPPAEEEGSKNEAYGQGANEYVYYVANSLTGGWTQLPSVTPEQIVTARQVRRFFTGDLAAPVLGFPRFPWGEAALLRAQIARIAASTTISPKGFYNTEGEEDDVQLVPNEEFEALSAEDLAQAENWCHHRAAILKQGRCKPFAKPEEEEAEEEEEKKEEEAPEEVEEAVALLGGLEADEVKLPAGAWSFRTYPAVPSAHAVSVAASNLWPGAATVVKKKAFAFIYVGFGQQQLTAPYAPPAPPAVQKEFVAEFNAEEGEADPMKEQQDPAPPADAPEEKDGEGDDDEDEEEGAGDANADE